MTTLASPPDVSIVMPVYFNEENLARTLASLSSEVIDPRPELRFEVVFVDDGSGDRSLHVLKDLPGTFPGAGPRREIDAEFRPGECTLVRLSARPRSVSGVDVSGWAGPALAREQDARRACERGIRAGDLRA